MDHRTLNQGALKSNGPFRSSFFLGSQVGVSGIGKGKLERQLQKNDELHWSCTLIDCGDNSLKCRAAPFVRICW